MTRSPDRGRVRGLFIAGDAAARCHPVDRASAIAGAGLAGDRYAEGRGTYSDGRSGRQLTLVATEALARVAAELGIALAPGSARRNVETSKLDLGSLIGRHFLIGDVECLGVRDCPPCAHLEQLTAPGVRVALDGVGGLRADILTSGTIAVGDPITPF